MLHTVYSSVSCIIAAVYGPPILSKSLMKRITSSSNACLRAVFGYRIKDISTSDLHEEADILTPFQKTYYNKEVTVSGGSSTPVNLRNSSWICFFRELTTSDMEYSTFSSQTWKESESLVLPIDTMTLSLLSDSWLDEREKLKKTLKTKMLEIFQQNVIS
jgi:hypothetical protein